MAYEKLLTEQDLIDIVTVDNVAYALVLPTRKNPVPGCTSLPITQLATRLRDFLARGYSERHRKPYATVAGVFPWTVFTYSLETLPPTKKQTFSHALAGTATREGLLASWRGEKLGRGAFITPLASENDVTAFLDHWGVPYTREVIYRER